VLSFKNIKERTEGMMHDLTGKVVDLLDDDSLEAIKVSLINSKSFFHNENFSS
jgi:hypothetical protein